MIVLLTDRFGELSETFVVNELRAMRAAGARVRVESVAHAQRPAAQADRVWLDDSAATRAWAMLRLALRHPRACARDLRARARWRREEPVFPLRMLAPAALRVAATDHVHVHFAAGAALCAMRIARIRGCTWSLTAHGWDIWQRPANLAEKLRHAAFATTGCEYNARHLRSLGGPVHVIVMGVDGEVFRRRTPHPDTRTVLAVGRRVPKKGFEDLAAAARELPDARVVIAGDGPVRPDGVELLGAVDHEGVRELLEQAAVLAVPCVIAPDGDRDSMPVVAKEALAMEVPVVATAEVGLPELIRPQWGALVPPHDPAALAAALAAELDRTPQERARRGSAGRAFVLEHADLHAETRKLLALIVDTQADRVGPRPLA